MFHNRLQAGELLAEKLTAFKNKGKVYVVGLPRGGVVTAWVIADKLNLPFFALAVKEIKHPYQPELALGAVGPAHTVYINDSLVKNSSLTVQDLAKTIAETDIEQKKSAEKFFQKKINWRKKTIILVDDGVATGATADCAIMYLRKQKVDKIILAVPIGAVDTIERLKANVDTIIVLESPQDFMAVGQYYEEFEEVEDEEVLRLLKLKSQNSKLKATI